MDAEELLEEVKRHRSKRRGGWGLIVVILIIVSLGAYWIIRPIVKQADFKISGQTFHVRVVHSDKDKEQGLALFKRPIEKDEGLLMVFDKSGYYSIWMKNIDYKIDVLWLDSNKKVIHYVENMDPKSYPETKFVNPNTSAKYVVELPANTIRDLKIKNGTASDFNIYSNDIRTVWSF